MANRKIYTATKFYEDTFFNRLNVITNNIDLQINDVKGYVDDKMNKINEYRTISVFEETEDVLVTPETAVVVPFKTIVSDSHFSGLTEGGDVELTKEGLYRIDVITDLDGNYGEGYVEMIVESMNGESEDGSLNEFVVKKHYLKESLVNSIVKSFNGEERLKVRVTGGSSEFSMRASVVVDKIY